MDDVTFESEHPTTPGHCCGFVWEDVETHFCGEHGPHDAHVCGDEEDCNASVPVTVGGGRKRPGRP